MGKNIIKTCVLAALAAASVSCAEDIIPEMPHTSDSRGPSGVDGAVISIETDTSMTEYDYTFTIGL